MGGDDRDQAITQEVKPVTEVVGSDQPSGTFINLSTKRGFRSTLGEVVDPPISVVSSRGPGSRQAASVSVVPCVPVVLGFPPDAFVSPAVGVGQAAPSSVGFPRPCVALWFTPSAAFGVGQSFTWTVSDVIAASSERPSARCSIARCASGDFWSPRATGVPHIVAAPFSFGSVERSPDRNPLPSSSFAVGVGQEPEPFALVRGTNGGRGEQTPFRSPPAFGKVGEDVREPLSNKLGDVLQEQESRFHVTYELPDGRPEPPVIVNTAPLACARERLAGEAGSDEIHAATERSTVERGEVSPDRRRIQVRLFHPGHESGRCVGVPLNVSHGSGGDSGESEGELKAAVAGAEVEGA